LDTILDYPKWILDWILDGFWLGPDLGWTESIWAHVELSQSESITIRVGPRTWRCWVSPGPCRSESTQANVKQSKFGSMSSWVGLCRIWVESTRAHVEQTQFGSMSSRVGRAVSTQTGVESSRPEPISSWCWDVSTLADVEMCLPWSISSWVGLDPSQADVEPCLLGLVSSQVGPISSWVDSGRNRVESVHADVELSPLGSMSNRVGPSPFEPMSGRVGPVRCRAESVRTHFRLMSSRVGSGSCWAEWLWMM